MYTACVHWVIPLDGLKKPEFLIQAYLYSIQMEKASFHYFYLNVCKSVQVWGHSEGLDGSNCLLIFETFAEVADPEDEDGEIVMEGARDKYDFKKIIEYPGFNCPTAPDTIDVSIPQHILTFILRIIIVIDFLNFFVTIILGVRQIK